MNLGQLLDGQEAVTAFNKGIQLMISSRENETLQVCLSCQSQGFISSFVREIFFQLCLLINHCCVWNGCLAPRQYDAPMAGNTHNPARSPNAVFQVPITLS